ncbi:MAG: hypothetical protein U0556_09205 [Dehalococcoidia bacterium]
MSDWPALVAGLRDGSVSSGALSAWLCAQKALWFVAEGDRDDTGQPINCRPLVVHHPSGATVGLLFTEEDRARRYLDDRDGDLMVVAASPADGFEALLGLPIDGIVINAADADHLNAGRRQLEALAAGTR